MTTHVPLGLWLAVLAAVALVLGMVVAEIWRSGAGAARGPVIAGLLAWLGVDLVLSGFGVFAAAPNRRVPLITAGLAIPLVAGIWLIGRPDGVGRLVDSIPLSRLIGVQVFRVAGVVFLLAWATGHMPGAFALPAGLGDIAVGLAAPLVAHRLRAHPDRARVTALLWSFAGIADLVVAVTLGFLTSPSPFQQLAFGHPNALVSRTPFVLIPVFAVPLSVVLHVAALRRLSQPAPVPASSEPAWA